MCRAQAVFYSCGGEIAALWLEPCSLPGSDTYGCPNLSYDCHFLWMECQICQHLRYKGLSKMHHSDWVSRDGGIVERGAAEKYSGPSIDEPRYIEQSREAVRRWLGWKGKDLSKLSFPSGQGGGSRLDVEHAMGFLSQAEKEAEEETEQDEEQQAEEKADKKTEKEAGEGPEKRVRKGAEEIEGEEAMDAAEE